MKNRNWLAYAGVIYVMTWIIGLLIESGLPSSSANQTELLAYFTTHQQSHMIQAYLIDGIAGIAILVFSAALAAHFRNLESDNSSFAQIVLGAGIAAASVSLVQAGFQEALSNPEIITTGSSSIRTILILVNQIDTFKLLVLALLSGAVSILVFRTRHFPVWYGWLGTALSLTLIVGGFSFISSKSAFTYVLFVSLPLLLFWVGALSVSMLQIGGKNPSNINTAGQTKTVVSSRHI
jgi:hypothetical protein